MSDHRPTRTNDKDDDARLLHAAARRRLSVAVADLALPDRLRLTEWQRVVVSGIFAKLVRAIEDELRMSLAEHPAVAAHQALHAALTSAHVAIAGPVIEASGVAADRPLVAALIRRAEEHRRFRARSATDAGLLIELIRDEDDAIAEQAMAIVIAQSRRFDRFSEPVAARTELSAELEYRLVWRVAAALRHYMVGQQGFDAAAADEAIVAAAERLLAAYDEGDSLEARAMRLGRRLHETGRLTDAALERAIGEGSFPLFIASLAVRAGLSYAAAWEVVSEPSGRGAVMLLKSAGVARAEAAAILLALGGDEDVIAAAIDLFEVTDDDSARSALRLWKINAGYREAIEELRA